MEKKEYIVTALTENQTGVLNRITAIYLRRKINIESLKVSESTIKGISMFIISSISTKEVIELIVQRIKNIVEVFDANYYTSDELITREIALFKVSKNIFNGSTSDIATEARIIEFGADYLVIARTGSKETINEFKNLLEENNLLIQFSSSGSVILHRESIEDKLKKFQINNL